MVQVPEGQARPREYLVTTPAENCAQPLQASVVSVALPGRASVALGQLGTSIGERGVWWLPLVLVPEWTTTHRAEPAASPAQHLLRVVLDYVQRMSSRW